MIEDPGASRLGRRSKLAAEAANALGERAVDRAQVGEGDDAAGGAGGGDHDGVGEVGGEALGLEEIVDA